MYGTDAKADETQYLLSSASALAQPPPPAKKRAASASPPPSQSASQAKKPKIVENAKVGDGQNAKSTKIAISVDEYCPLAHYEVYIDHDGLIWDASLNQTSASANSK
jgi:poly [ADP-ribose] polymerase